MRSQILAQLKAILTERAPSATPVLCVGAAQTAPHTVSFSPPTSRVSRPDPVPVYVSLSPVPVEPGHKYQTPGINWIIMSATLNHLPRPIEEQLPLLNEVGERL